MDESLDRGGYLLQSPVPIATDAEGARRFLGCSRSMFEELRAKKIIVALRRDWYSYADLTEAVTLLRKQRGTELILFHEEASIEEAKGPRSKKQNRHLVGKGHRPDYRCTEELLRENRR